MASNHLPLVVADLGGSPSGGDLFHQQVTRSWQSEPIRVPGGWPHPTTADLDQLAEVLLGLRGPVLIDGLLGCAAPTVLSRARVDGVQPWILVHLPLAAEDPTAHDAGDLNTRERAALDGAAGVVTTSQWAKTDLLERHGPREIAVVQPGVAQGQSRVHSRVSAPAHLVSVASYTPRKNHDLLITALAQIKDLEWQATWAGAAPAGAVERLHESLKAHDLLDRVRLTGPLGPREMAALWQSSDLLVSPSLFETYGMVITEALAHGIPAMVSSETASQETLAGPMELLPGMANSALNPSDWADALRRWLAEPAHRQRWESWVGERSNHLRTWDECARELIESVGGHRDT